MRYQARLDREVLGFATQETPLGVLLVATSDRGVRAAALADSNEELEANLSARFGPAERRTDLGLQRLLSSVAALIDSPSQQADLPLDLIGTPFQREVWDALLRIPVGQRLTYAGLAAGLGRPSAARAVASACAANPVAVAVPCHRVVRGDGGLGGYRWGLQRKRELLAREAGVAQRACDVSI